MLAQAPAPRVLVLGDMGEVGTEGRKFHEEIGAYARGRGIDHLLTLGDLAGSASNAFGAGARHYEHVRNAELMRHSIGQLTHVRCHRAGQGFALHAMERVVQHLIGR